MSGKQEQIQLPPQAAEIIAQVAHEANAAYCRSLDDDSQPSWADAPDWQRESAINGVEFHCANPNAGPDASHKNWMAQKKADGWKHGEEKDPEKKTHPCMVAFSKLPVEQQFKDTLFATIVKALAPRLLEGERNFAVVAEERDALKRSLVAQKGATTKAKNEVEALEESAKPRALGPLEKPLKIEELAELLADTATVDIAFSDGKAEIPGTAPMRVPASAFTLKRGKLELHVPSLQLRAPDDERGARALLGFALLVDGEQVAWAPRLAGQLTLGAGSTYELKNDVVLT